MPELETVDVAGIEILSAGGPVHGVGSPPEGDYWTRDDLEAIAAANRELAGELKPPNKIGHSGAQALLLNSGLTAPTPGEMPAVGWLDGATFRVEERDGVAKLIADGKDVPKKFSQLLETKAYRTRSVELSRVESQEQQVDGKPKVYDWVVTGLAWLGAKLPAVRTLDDIVALYEEEDLAAPGARVFVFYAEGDVVWEPDAGFQHLRDQVNEALNGPPTGGMNEPRFWVRDVDVALSNALVEDYYDDGSQGWVVPFTRADGGDITIAPSSDWTQVERGWVEAARELEQRLTVRASAADIRRDMGETTKSYTDDQRRAFAEASGMELDKVTDEVLKAAGVAEPAKEEPARDLEADDRIRSLEEKVEEEAQARRDLEAKLATQERDSFVESVLRDGKAAPSQRDAIVALYEESPAAATKFYSDAPVNDTWAREYGSDSDEILDDDAREAQDKAYEADAQRRGIPVVL